MKVHVLARSGERDIKFTGALVAEATVQTSAFRESIGRIYRTKGGSYIAEHIERSTLSEYGTDAGRASACADGAAILEFFTITPDVKKPKVRKVLDVGKAVLAKAEKLEPTLLDSHVETID